METLLMVFIGLVALALVVIAAGIGAVAWYLVKLIEEITVIARKLHAAGEIVADDLAELRGAVKGGAGQFIYHLTRKLWPKKTTPRRSQPPQE